MQESLKFQGKLILSACLLAETGLRIGGTTEGIEIGGVDNPVIRDPLSERPYIPGSSLKGKLRHLLEWSLGKIEKHPKHRDYTAHFCGECDACVMFGPSSDDDEVREKAGPSRLLVRDAFPTASTVGLWERWLGEHIYTELKNENYVDRVTAAANPRTMERVPAGSRFVVEIVYDMYRAEDRPRFAQLLRAIYLLENSALGGSGSRGHGQVKFADLRIVERSTAHYVSGVPETVLFMASSHPTVEYPKRPEKHRIERLRGEQPGTPLEVDFEESLPRYVAEQWSAARG